MEMASEFIIFSFFAFNAFEMLLGENSIAFE